MYIIHTNIHTYIGYVLYITYIDTYVYTQAYIHIYVLYVTYIHMYALTYIRTCIYTHT